MLQDKFKDVDFKYGYNFFSTSSPKIPKQRISGSKIRHFYFFIKFCNETNSRVLISNMTILFSNYSPKIIEHTFLVPNLRIFIFALNYATRQMQGRWFQIDNIFFKFKPKNTQIRHFWFQIKAFLFFHQILQLDKFEGADFKCGNSFLKFQSNKKNSKISNMTIAFSNDR